MGERWLTRLSGALPARPARQAAGVTLAVAAVSQAAIQAVTADHGTAGIPLDPGLLVFLTACALCALALLATVPLCLDRPVTAALVSAGATLVTLATFPAPTVAGTLATVLAVGRLGADGELRLGAARHNTGLPGAEARYPVAQYLAVALGLPFGALALARHEDTTCVLLATVIPAAAGAGIALRAGRAARTYSEAGQALASTLVAHTARGERARIARELHDVVAHHISMIAVQAETGRLAIPGLPEAGARRFGEIGDTARAGLTEMRRLLGVLREDAADAAQVTQAGPEAAASRQPQPGLSQLAELVDAAREASLAGTRLIISGPVAALDPGVELAAYRIVQEALTNARRHAPGAAVDVELRYGDGALRLRVRDNGAGPAGTAPGPRRPAGEDGHGLAGMRERAFSVGGALYTGAAPGGGFLVEALLPAEPDPVRRPVEAVAARR